MHTSCHSSLIKVSKFVLAKRTPGKTKEEAQLEKKHELEKRLQDVKGQLGQPNKKTPRKGQILQYYACTCYNAIMLDLTNYKFIIFIIIVR